MCIQVELEFSDSVYGRIVSALKDRYGNLKPSSLFRIAVCETADKDGKIPECPMYTIVDKIGGRPKADR